jgi:type II secretory ATPase GspE/PulE/Tfp pilus assembly ATPase PilB-like protein
MEILHVDDELEELLACRGSPRELRQAALAKGFRPLRDEARLRVLAGDTSLEEVRRVVDLGCGGC